jgi:ribokinase
MRTFADIKIDLFTMSTPIYVIGSSNTDMVIKAASLPKPGETVLGGTFLMNAGGKGANQAVTAARLGGKVTFIANVGNDIFGKQAIQQFQKENINTSFITTDQDQPSGVALINVDEKGENSIVVAPGANGKLNILKVKQALDSIEAPAILLLQLEIPLGTVEYIIEEAHKKNLSVILNPAPANTLKEELLQYLFLVTPNESEAELLTGKKVIDEVTAADAASILQQKGVRNVVITMGAKGAYVLSESFTGMIPAPLVTAIDTTAAGDCFNGALVVALGERIALNDAVAYACKAASISVTRMGAQSSLPMRNELDQLQFAKPVVVGANGK